MHKTQFAAYAISEEEEIVLKEAFRTDKEGLDVVAVNTNKFKVITKSAKKNDANYAATLAFHLFKEFLWPA